MEQITTKVRKWGHSFGLLIPKKVIEDQELGEGSIVSIVLQAKRITTGRDIYGMLSGKFKKDTDAIMREVDEAFWPELG